MIQADRCGIVLPHFQAQRWNALLTKLALDGLEQTRRQPLSAQLKINHQRIQSRRDALGVTEHQQVAKQPTVGQGQHLPYRARRTQVMA